jgi:DNA adenine methylase
MTKTAPHVIPYQGSKRKLSKAILSHINLKEIDTLYEPFAGSAAISIAASQFNLTKRHVIGDKYKTITDLLHLIINEPEFLSHSYANVWNKQLSNPNEYFNDIRSKFNQDKDPVKFLYLIARCVKNAIRFNSQGEFNQSPDKRRLGTKPDKMSKNIFDVSKLLIGKTDIFCDDFTEVIKSATSKDLIYMDPPWQGTSNKKDTRYAHVLNIDTLINEMESLNSRNVPFILSFDGVCGDKSYGKDLPKELNLTKINLDAGRSSQATLLGRTDKTIESLYLSPALK